MSTMTPQKFSQLRQKAGKRRRLSPEQLQGALIELGLSPEMLATLLSTRVERIRTWLSGAEDIPVYLDVLMGLLSLPGGPAMARDVLARAEAVPTDQGEAFDAWARRAG